MLYVLGCRRRAFSAVCEAQVATSHSVARAALTFSTSVVVLRDCDALGHAQPIHFNGEKFFPMYLVQSAHSSIATMLIPAGTYRMRVV